MTVDEARRVLGVAPGDDPTARLEEFEAARERIAKLIRRAPNDAIALRYQDWLQEFERARAVVKQDLERRGGGLVAGTVSAPVAVAGSEVGAGRGEWFPGKAAPVPRVVAEVAAPEAPPAPAPTTPLGAPSRRPRRRGLKLRTMLYALVFLSIGGAGGAWLFYHMQAERDVRRQKELAYLEGLGATLVEGRVWNEAMEAYRRIEEIAPGSEAAIYGMRSIEVGMREEQEQFVGYWSGEALSALEAGRLDDAREAADKVLERYPGEREVLKLRNQIELARRHQLRERGEAEVRAAVGESDWARADEALATLGGELPGDPIVRVLAAEIEQARERQRRDHERARELADAARLRDEGKFDSQVLEWMREAVALAPDDPEIQEMYEKIASYSRTLRVPEDVPTLAGALASARDRDRVVLGEGTFTGGVSVNAAIQIEGAGADKTVLEAAADEAPVLTLGPGAKGAVVSGLVFRKKGFDPSESRFPAVQLLGAEVSFSDCLFESASGHGLEVTEGGSAEVLRCRFKGNGWDGAAARGAGSRLHVRESRAEGNFGHGFEVWDGGLLTMRDSVSKRNSRGGVVVDSAVDGIEITGNEIFGNREYGVVLAAGSSGRVTENSCHANLRGGMVIRFAAISMVVEKNRLEKNSGPGLILEQGLRADIYGNNVTRDNESGELVADVPFADAE